MSLKLIYKGLSDEAKDYYLSLDQSIIDQLLALVQDNYDFKLLKNYTKDSRDYAEKHGQELLHGTAVIITSHLSRFILNTFMKLKKADIPLKAFKTKDDAVNWLLQLKKSNQLNGIY